MNINIIKGLKTFLVFMTVGILAYACEEEPVGQQPLDSVAPDKVTNVAVKSIPGGAMLYYTLPANEDLLYVKAVYTLSDGEERDVKASIYTDSLEITGFGDTIPRQVRLIAVDRSKNESQPEVITIKPGTPPVWTIGETLTLMDDFGGMHAYWDNPLKSKISVHILKKDENDEYVPLETFYSALAIGDAAVRGLDTVPIDVQIFVEDRWGNRCETKAYTITPIYETLFDRELHRKMRLNNDISDFGDSWSVAALFDGNKNGDPCFSSPAGTGIWPQWITMDMGVVGKLSRIRVYQRCSNDAYIWWEGNIREFELWGRIDEPDFSGDWAGWTLLKDCVSVKPSGSPYGTNTDEDLYVARNGEDFIMPIDIPPVRYLRFLVKRTWADGSNFQIGEVEIYGDNRY
jgi:hypothetical protein